MSLPPTSVPIHRCLGPHGDSDWRETRSRLLERGSLIDRVNAPYEAGVSSVRFPKWAGGGIDGFVIDYLSEFLSLNRNTIPPFLLCEGDSLKFIFVLCVTGESADSMTKQIIGK